MEPRPVDDGRAHRSADGALGTVAPDGSAVSSPEPPWWQVLIEPTIPVIALAEIAHVARRNRADILVFAAIAVAIVVDRLRPLPPTASAARNPRRRPWSPGHVIAACVGYGLLVVPLARAGWALPLVLAIPGLVALVAVWRARPPSHSALSSHPLPGGWVLWPSLILATLLFELANFLSQPDAQTSNPAHPVLSDIIEPLLSSGLARGAVCAVWLAVGIWLVRRIRSVNGVRP